MPKGKTTRRPGRPLKYETPEELQAAIDAYFAECDKTGDPYTVTGLALAVDMSREGLINYQNREPYFDAIKRAKQRVLAYAEKCLYKNGQVAGVIFNLKNNYGWVDKREIDVTDKTDHAGLFDKIRSSTGENRGPKNRVVDAANATDENGRCGGGG